MARDTVVLFPVPVAGPAWPAPVPAATQSTAQSCAQSCAQSAAQAVSVPESSDHFVCRDGVVFAGTHLILDLWDAAPLDDLALMETVLRESVRVAGATLLHIHLHHFTENGGISGVAVLAESHISVHTWPERGFAAFDVFMCGDAEPARVIDVLRAAFSPSRLIVGEHRRGLVSDE